MAYRRTIRGVTHSFSSLRQLMAEASPPRSGDELAGIAAGGAEQRVIAQMTLAEVPLSEFLNDLVVPYESDEVTRLIVDTLDGQAFAAVAGLTVGEFRDWLLSDAATGERLAELAPGLMPEMAAAVSKVMRAQDLIAVASKIRVVTRFRTTVGLLGRMSTRLQPNHPTDDARGIAAAMLDGLLLGSGDAVIGINPVSDNAGTVTGLLRMIDHVQDAVCDSDAELRAGACDDADGGDAAGGSAGPGVSIDCGNGGGECFVWGDAGLAGGGGGDGAVVEAGWD